MAQKKLYPILLVATALLFFYLIQFVGFTVPQAQAEAGGIAQKIFYFHVPSAYAMYLCGTVCFVASCGYLYRPSDTWDAWARAGSECAVAFGSMVLLSGPLWAKKAWGVYWTWDPRLTTLLLTVLIYAALVVMRAFTGDGDAERKFAAGFGILGTVNLPIVHYSVKKWGGNHPTVVGQGGGGLRDPDMVTALSLGFLAMTLLAVLLIVARANLAQARARVAALEEQAAVDGILESP
ncbi:MAG: cytochrome c biogenesis protein CcsA [Polyangiaceae bacterium]|nr:cytochrome c biogenesis protein CcsA [Polyangiaceae bacterium]